MHLKVSRDAVGCVAARLTEMWNQATADYHAAVEQNDQMAATWARSRSLAFGQALEVLFDETGD